VPGSLATRDVEALLGIGERRRGVLARHRLAWTLVAALVLAGAAALWASGSNRAAVSYITEPASRGSLTVTVTATGSAQPITQVNVSSELSGTVRKVHVDYNSPVKVGQALAELDTDKLNAAMESLRARREAASSRVADAAATIEERRADYDRKKALAARQIVSDKDLDLSRAAFERAVAAHTSAIAEVKVVEADLRVGEINLAKACICSPIDGMVLKRSVDPGQIVASSLQTPVLFVLAQDLRQMELQVDVDEADVGKVKVGQQATFEVDAYPERKFPATIRDIRFGSEIVQGVVTYKAVLTIDNSELMIRPGMTATAQIVVQRIQDALLVPNAALRFSPPAAQAPDQRSLLRRILPGPPTFRPPSKPEEAGASRSAFVLREGAPVAVAIVVGATDGRRTEIVEGEIAPGDPVIVDAVSGSR
jgi:HlyD family secretion protein